MTRAWRYRKGKTTTNLASEPGYSLPFVFRAIVLGLEISRKIPAEKFNKYVYVILLVLGMILLIKVMAA
jgi:hypothetical protein